MVGYDAGKQIKGRKRHLVTDTLGLMLRVEVHSASVQDRDGAASFAEDHVIVSVLAAHSSAPR